MIAHNRIKYAADVVRFFKDNPTYTCISVQYINKLFFNDGVYYIWYKSEDLESANAEIAELEQHSLLKMDESPQYTSLYPKYNCPTCGDWFHMPYKYCKCDKKESGDGK